LSSGTSDNDDDVVIARVIKARGVRGEVACDVETDFPERFGEMKQMTMLLPDDSRISLAVQDQWFHGDRVILKFEGVDTMTDAEKLVGSRLVISQRDERNLEDGEFFEYSLVGMQAVTTDGKSLGQVVQLIRTGGTDVLVVRDDNREYLIPFADEICTDVDISARRLTVDPPAGLLDL
jgi:16S rRNA processing protein RimM